MLRQSDKNSLVARWLLDSYHKTKYPRLNSILILSTLGDLRNFIPTGPDRAANLELYKKTLTEFNQQINQLMVFYRECSILAGVQEK